MVRTIWVAIVFPAHAGMSPQKLLPEIADQRFPRACGDEPKISDEMAADYGVFPAHAGMSRRHRIIFSPGLRFPRACGDEPSIFPARRPMQSFSPRMRG